jgi:hypothetical protein
MRTLTPKQLAAVDAARARWLEWIFSTEPADRDRAEEGVRLTYRAAGAPEPEIFLWFDDLGEALLATEQLSERRASNWMLPPESLRLREDVQQRVQTSLGLPMWEDVVKAVGPWHSPNRYVRKQHNGIGFMVAVPRRDSLQAGLPALAEDPPGDCGAIEDAAQSVRRAAFASYSEIETIAEHAAGPGIPGHPGIGSVPTVYRDYRLDQLFRHDCLLSILGERDSARYNGLRLTVQYCGPWWAFANAAILCDRPRVMRRDSEARLHDEEGPAVIFGNGMKLFAWHGSWVPESAIRRPETLTRTMIKAESDPQVQAALIQIYGAERYERERRPAPPRKPRNPLLISLPELLDDKINALRTYGPLPYYERYLAGEHRQVWQELGAMGARIREDGYAPDALAVAYTTMTRVRHNIATIIERLRKLGYEFETESEDQDKVIQYGVARLNLWLNIPRDRPAPFRPPERGWANLKRFEKDAGELPLSLRAWYEVVGSVTLLGKHPVLSPGDGTVLPDQLVVVPFSQILRDWDNSPPDVGVDGRPFLAEVAPDATSKAQGTGLSYRIPLPSVGMDALLENEPHQLPFVDYLRLAIQWGGFPGFKSVRNNELKEIEFLNDGLLPF